MNNNKLFEQSGKQVGQVLGTAGGIYVSGQASGGIIGSVSGGKIGGELGGKIGSTIGKSIDIQCSQESKQLQMYYNEAIKSGTSKSVAVNYASTMVYPRDW